MSEVKMDIKPNSHRYKAEQQAKLSEEKKVSKVTSGRVRTKKKSEIAKMKDSIISPEASGMQSYIFGSVLIPAVKKLMSDIVKDGIDILLYGDTLRSSRDRDYRDRYSNGATYVSYRSYSDRDRDDRERRRESRYAYDYKELIFDNRSDAKEVLDTLLDILDTYDSVSVGDLYDAVGMSHNYTDNDYGWTNLSSAEVVCIRGDYMLRLPKAKPLR